MVTLYNPTHQQHRGYYVLPLWTDESEFTHMQCIFFAWWTRSSKPRETRYIWHILWSQLSRGLTHFFFIWDELLLYKKFCVKPREYSGDQYVRDWLNLFLYESSWYGSKTLDQTGRVFYSMNCVELTQSFSICIMLSLYPKNWINTGEYCCTF